MHDQDPKEVLKLEDRLRQSLLSAKTAKQPSSSEVKITSKKNNELWLQRDTNSGSLITSVQVFVDQSANQNVSCISLLGLVS